MGRHKRSAKIYELDAARIRDEAGRLNAAMIAAKVSLAPSSEHYGALMKLGDDIRIALNILAGRPADYVESFVKPSFMAGLPRRPTDE